MSKQLDSISPQRLLAISVDGKSEEKRHSPGLQVTDKQAYINLMSGLVLEDPKLMDVVVPRNRQCGLKAVA